MTDSAIASPSVRLPKLVQGVGFATTEELVYDEKGGLVTDNIWSYKPPCSKTIPLDFRVRLHPVEAGEGAEHVGDHEGTVLLVVLEEEGERA